MRVDSEMGSRQLATRRDPKKDGGFTFGWASGGERAVNVTGLSTFLWHKLGYRGLQRLRWETITEISEARRRLAVLQEEAFQIDRAIAVKAHKRRPVRGTTG